MLQYFEIKLNQQRDIRNYFSNNEPVMTEMRDYQTKFARKRNKDRQEEKLKNQTYKIQKERQDRIDKKLEKFQ